MELTVNDTIRLWCRAMGATMQAMSDKETGLRVRDMRTIAGFLLDAGQASDEQITVTLRAAVMIDARAEQIMASK